MPFLVEGIPIFVELTVLAFAPGMVVWVVLAMLALLRAGLVVLATLPLRRLALMRLVVTAAEDSADGLTDS